MVDKSAKGPIPEKRVANDKGSPKPAERGQFIRGTATPDTTKKGR